MKRSASQSLPLGFTLIEVLLALALFVGSAAALSRLIIIGIENAEFAKEQTEAMIIAEARWSELESGILTISSLGTFPAEEFPGWQWTMAANADQTTGLYQVVLNVQKIVEAPRVGYTLKLTRLWFDETTATQTTTSTSTASPAPSGNTGGTQ